MQYIWLVAKFTFRKTFAYTDIAATLLGAIVVSFFWMFPTAAPKNTSEFIAVSVFFIAASITTLRLIAAPYFIWHENQSTISDLSDRLKSEDFRQANLYRQSLDEQRIAVIKKLSTIQLSSDAFWDTYIEEKEAALLAVEPGFAHAFSIWKEASRGISTYVGRDMTGINVRIGLALVERLTKIYRQRASAAVAAMLDSITMRNDPTNSNLESVLQATSDDLRAALDELDARRAE